MSTTIVPIATKHARLVTDFEGVWFVKSHGL